MSELGAKRIFICDDQPIVIEGVKKTISSLTHLSLCGSALTVEDAEENIQRLKPDLLILDLFVNGADGAQLLEKTWNSDFSFSPIFYGSSGIWVLYHKLNCVLLTLFREFLIFRCIRHGYNSACFSAGFQALMHRRSQSSTHT
ncbi:MAG: response regulator [Candidatus Hinthialibacter antarcticus]|nr:response regulator [Candidatus Hinthialibacter antarcticus]